MTKTIRFTALAMVAATALALCLLALVVVQPAGAAYPGKNGEIAFQSTRDASVEIYTVNPNGGTAARITFPFGGNGDPAYSPDGSRIAFSKGGDIHVMKATGMNPDGTGSRRLTSMNGAELDPTWSTDGTRIAFLSNTDDGAGQTTDPLTTDSEIWVMNADGSGRRPITENSSEERDPAWSPKDNKIAFVDERGDSPFFDTDSNVYVMNTDGSNQTNITPNISGTVNPYQGYDEDPAWSPDSETIAYVHGRTGTGGDAQDIWTMTPSGANKTNITDDAETTDNLIPEFEPAWSPLGDKIAYSVKETPNQDIGWMNADGTSEHAIDTGDDTRKDEKPDWQPIPVCTKSVNAANDPLVGTAAKDVLCGDRRANTINGAGGNDIVLAQGGNDRLTGALGNDTLNGGPGTDTVLYSGATAVIANLTTEFATGVGVDVLLGTENLSGSSANDRLTGSAVANALVGGAGADVLSGLGGPDTLNSKDGVNGNDTVNGGAGTDRCVTDARERSITSCP